MSLEQYISISTHPEHRKAVQTRHLARYETTKAKTRSESYFRCPKSQNSRTSKQGFPPRSERKVAFNHLTDLQVVLNNCKLD